MEEKDAAKQGRPCLRFALHREAVHTYGAFSFVFLLSSIKPREKRSNTT